MKYSYHRSKRNHKMLKIIKVLRKFEWKHHNLILFCLSLFFAYYILKYKPIVTFIQNLSYLGYLAAFILGTFFSYALTSVPASAALFNLGNQLNPFLIAFIGAFGSVMSDYIIFRFVRDRLLDEIKLLSEEINGFTRPLTDRILPKDLLVMIWKSVSRSKVWKALIPVIAGLIIASPLPDEIGVALFGASKFEPKKFVFISYFLNFLGILIITSLGSFA
jgi:uncharacterized membrane protein YdjX (TVP38/TMEM64 family)